MFTESRAASVLVDASVVCMEDLGALRGMPLYSQLTPTVLRRCPVLFSGALSSECPFHIGNERRFSAKYI